MLPRPLRVTRSPEHRELARRGHRASTTTLVVHLAPPPVGPDGADGRVRAAVPSGRRTPPARAGVVVGRPVGDAVTRHRVARRLRHLLAVRLAVLEPGTTLVVRARPAAAAASSAVLGADLDVALARATRSGSRSHSTPPRPGRSRSARAPVTP